MHESKDSNEPRRPELLRQVLARQAAYVLNRLKRLGRTRHNDDDDQGGAGDAGSRPR